MSPRKTSGRFALGLHNHSLQLSLRGVGRYLFILFYFIFKVSTRPRFSYSLRDTHRFVYEIEPLRDIQSSPSKCHMFFPRYHHYQQQSSSMKCNRYATSFRQHQNVIFVLHYHHHHFAVFVHEVQYHPDTHKGPSDFVRFR